MCRPNSSSGLSGGGLAGVIVGVIMGVAVLIAVALYVHGRRQPLLPTGMSGECSKKLRSAEL